MTLLSQRERFTIGDGETRRKTARARGTFPFNPLPPRHLSRQKYVNPPFINPYITAPYGGRDESHGTKDKRGLSAFASAEERRKTFSSSPPSQTFFPSQPLLPRKSFCRTHSLFSYVSRLRYIYCPHPPPPPLENAAIRLGLANTVITRRRLLLPPARGK